MRRRLSLPRRGLLLFAVALLVVVGAGFFWLRDSSFVEVDQVTVSGATGPDAPKIEAALRGAARDMTTLNVREDELEKAVSDFPTVGGLRVDTDLPHAMRIEVVERTPVAVIGEGDKRVPVTAGGRLLKGATADDRLPVLDVKGRVEGRIDDRRSRTALTVYGAAPRPLLHRTQGAEFGSRGVTLKLEDGPDLLFGTTDDLEAKWAAAARVLAEPAASGAQYIDVRVPDRVAAGGLAEPAEDPADPSDPAAQTDPAAPVDPAVTQPADPASTTPAPAVPETPVPAPGTTAPAP